MSDWKETLAPTPECIDIARFEDLTEADRVHLGTCVRCQTELALYREVMSEETSPASQWIASRLRTRSAVGVRPQSRSGGVRTGIYAIAAALVLLIGLNVWMQYRESSIDVDLSPGMYRSARLDVVGPEGDIPAAPNELRWQPVPEATRYSVQLVDVGAAGLWSADTTQTYVLLPPEARAEFKPGRTVLWTVTAYRGNEVLAESPTQNVRVTP